MIELHLLIYCLLGHEFAISELAYLIHSEKPGPLLRMSL